MLQELLDKINWKMVAFTAFPFVGSIAGSIITKNNIKSGWYESLKFPSFRPPNWVFGPVWTTLYLGMGYSSYLVYKTGGSSFTGPAKIPLILYGTQLALNFAWTPIFFHYHKLRLAFYELLVLLGSIGATTISYYPVNKTAAFLMIPYIAWSSFAGVLNYSIMKLNEKKE